jgi:hypothetical protein
LDSGKKPIKTKKWSSAENSSQKQKKSPVLQWMIPVILATCKAEIGRSWFQVSQGIKNSEAPIQWNKSGVVTHTCHPSCEGKG